MVNRPTDDELEEAAVNFSQAADLSCFLSNDEYRRTAAMLRACKGRVGRFSEVDRSALILTAACAKHSKACDGGYSLVGGAAATAAVDAILAALDPAPDHAEWNAAIEAAVEIATDWTLGPEEVAPAIRSLKKGTPQ